MDTRFNSHVIWERWTKNSERNPDRDAVIHWVAGEEPVRFTFSQLLEKANHFSFLLHSLGIKPGEVCAIILHHNPNFYPLYMGVVGLGTIPAVLAYPNPRLHPDKFRQGIEGMSQRSGLDWILTEREIFELISPLLQANKTTIKGVHFPLEKIEFEIDDNAINLINERRKNFTPDGPVLLQHSSGTTGLQKPVLLSNKAVSIHVDNLAKALDLAENDKIISWLPLYHDMGLIGSFHFPLAYGIPFVQIDPFEWVLAPVLMLEAASKEKGTIGWIPNFAYHIMADKIDEDELDNCDLSSFRLLINCSEPVREDGMNRFADKFSNYGFKKSALAASYAMAETTFAITQTPAGEGVRNILIDREAFSKGKVKIVDSSVPHKVACSSGILIDGCEMAIVDDNRNVLTEEYIGELKVKSVSIFDGYRNYPEKTAEVFDGEWYYTGDYGFVHDNHWYVIGRKKDIIISAGKNIYPEDIEDVMNQVEGIIPGRVIAFGQDDETLGTEVIAVLAETKYESIEDKKKLRLAIINAGMGMDVNVHFVYLVPPRWLIKSSAGKPSRKANRERISNLEEQQKWLVT